LFIAGNERRATLGWTVGNGQIGHFWTPDVAIHRTGAEKPARLASGSSPTTDDDGV
jgi:hypothetical protein